MTVELDRPIYAGGAAVAAIVSRSVHAGAWRGLAICGSKRPIAVLVRRDGRTAAFEADGRPIPRDELERRFPEQYAEFERLMVAAATRPE